MSLHSRSTYKDWGDDEDDDSTSPIQWLSPGPNAILVSGDKLVATWSTPVRPIASPSFQLCLVENEECGDTVWPKVKKLPNGQYTITLKIPQLGSDNDFFVRMIDDKGSAYDTPEFKLQAGGPPPSSALALNSGSSSSSSVLPDSLSSTLPDSDPVTSDGYEGLNGNGSDNLGSSGSSSSPSGVEGEGKWRPQSGGEGTDRAAPKNAGKGSGSPNNGTATMSIARNSTIASSTTPISSLTLAPSITNSALIGSSNDNKPSTAAIVVPLAIFAAALAGLLFSLRQRSKAKEIRGPTNETALNRGTSKDSGTSVSGTSGSGSSRTDLERAMEFITRIRAPHSPQLTPLPPSIESRRRERRESRMRQSDEPLRTEVPPERASTPTSFNTANREKQVRPQNGPLPPIPIVAELYPIAEHDIPRSETYTIAPSHRPGLPQLVHQVSAPAPAEEPARPLTHSLVLGSESHSDVPRTTSTPAVTHLPTSLSFAGMPRPPSFTQLSVRVIPSSASQPSIATGSTYYPSPFTLASNSKPLPHATLPDSLRAALPRPPTAPAPEVIVNPTYPVCLESQAQPQPRYEPADQSPIRPRPAVPYSTRPQPTAHQINAVPNPYEAIAKALRTPRLG